MRSTIAASFSLLLAMSAVEAVTYLTEPQVIRSDATEWSLDLHIKPHQVVNDQLTVTTRLYCVEDVCSYPGPTISVKPGDVFTLNLFNDLSAEFIAPQADPYADMDTWMNIPHVSQRGRSEGRNEAMYHAGFI